jgi:hypothetical protein
MSPACALNIDMKKASEYRAHAQERRELAASMPLETIARR